LGTDGAGTDGERTISDREALIQDLTLVAQSNGWTFAEAAAQHQASEIIGAIAEHVYAERRDQFVGSALSDLPGGPPRLYLKGKADAYITRLVESSEIPVIIADDQPFSFDELQERKLLVHETLVGLGFQIVATGTDITDGGIIHAAVTTEPGLQSDPPAIVGQLPFSVRSDVVLRVRESAVVQDLSAFGGWDMRSSGVALCTSGFSVAHNSSGTTGVTTAGHCTGINELDHSGTIHNLTMQNQHRGQWGDIEWHTSPVSEPAQFLADQFGNIRNVNAIEGPAGMTIGEPVCFWGQWSHAIDCTLEIADTSVSCTNNGVFNDRLVRMNGLGVAIDGDSGGPFFYGTKAFGALKGGCQPDFPNKLTFSAAHLYDEAMNVTVRT
jgi:hypothetical protein